MKKLILFFILLILFVVIYSSITLVCSYVLDVSFNELKSSIPNIIFVGIISVILSAAITDDISDSAMFVRL